jgi:hypothetical protein
MVVAEICSQSRKILLYGVYMVEGYGSAGIYYYG